MLYPLELQGAWLNHEWILPAFENGSSQAIEALHLDHREPRLDLFVQVSAFLSAYPAWTGLSISTRTPRNFFLPAAHLAHTAAGTFDAFPHRHGHAHG